jgi:hypothetical protein
MLTATARKQRAEVIVGIFTQNDEIRLIYFN